jgi:hypothetical protein
MATGRFLNNAKEKNLDKDLGPMNTTSLLGPRPFPPPGVGLSKRCTNQGPHLFHRGLLHEKLDIESRFEFHQMDNIVAGR